MILYLYEKTSKFDGHGQYRSYRYSDEFGYLITGKSLEDNEQFTAEDGFLSSYVAKKSATGSLCILAGAYFMRDQLYLSSLDASTLALIFGLFVLAAFFHCLVVISNSERRVQYLNRRNPNAEAAYQKLLRGDMTVQDFRKFVH